MTKAVYCVKLMFVIILMGIFVPFVATEEKIDTLTFSDIFNPNFEIGYIGMAGVGPVVAKALVNPDNYLDGTFAKGTFKTTCVEKSEAPGALTVTLSLVQNEKEIRRVTFTLRSRLNRNYVTYIYFINTETGEIYANFNEKGDGMEPSIDWIDPFCDVIYDFYDTDKLFADK
jgi:hypothetical protein